MKSIHLAAAAVLATAASFPAFAEEAEPIAVTLTPIGAGTLGASFQRNVSGLFVDTFAFTPSVAGTASVTLTPLSGPVTFYSALLNGEGFSQPPNAGTSPFSFESMVSADMPLSLTVLGFSGNADTLAAAAGSYAATISAQTVAAIPEPETYALMLAGLGAIGWVGRRSRRHAAPANRSS